MAVPVNKRGENTLEVWLKAVDLVKYTMEITANTKNFPGRYRAMTDPAKLERYWKTLTKELI